MHYYIFFIFIFDETTLWWCSLSSCVVALNIFISLHSIPIKHIITNFQNDKVQLNNIRAKQGACLQLWKNSTSPRLSFFFFNFVLFSWYCTNLSPHWLMFLVWQKSEVKYYTGPMFTLHQINAFEDSEFLVMDMCCGDDGELIGEFTLENLRRNSGEEIDEVNALSLLVCYQWTAQIEMLAFTKTTTRVTST